MALDVKKMLSGSGSPDWIKSQDLISKLQYRINKEETASRIYLAMSNWANIHGWLGTSSFMRKQASEEYHHGEEFAQFLLGLNVQPIVDVLPKPVKQSFSSLHEMFQDVMVLELQVTKECNEIADLSMQVKDYVVHEIALKFCKEQHQEISTMRTILDLLELAGDDKSALLFIDKQIGEM